MRTFEAYHRGLVSAEDVVELIGILARLAGVSSSCTYFNRFLSYPGRLSTHGLGFSESVDYLSPQRKVLRVRRVKMTRLPVDGQLISALSELHLGQEPIITYPSLLVMQLSVTHGLGVFTRRR